MLREFQYHDATSAKFWRIAVAKSDTTVQYGRIGTEGQTQTKSHPSEQAAQAFANKQIAEKLKKGYAEVAATATPAPAPASTPAPEPASTPAPEPAPVHAPAPVALPSASDEELVLEPTDWFWANWRKTEPLPRPTSQPPFDKAAALKRAQQVTKGRPSWDWRWELARIPHLPSREEAHFWLTLLANTNTKDPQKAINTLTQSTIDGNLSAQQAFELVPFENNRNYELWVNLMTAFMPLDQIFARLYSQLQPLSQLRNPYSTPSIHHFLGGLRRYVLPYLTKAERERAIASLPATLDLTTWPQPQSYNAPPPEFHLAAMLGSHQADLIALLNSWPTTLFSSLEYGYTNRQLPQEIILGLQDPELVIEYMRRFHIKLLSSEHIRAWLAHTEFSALDVVRDSIVVESNKDNAATLIEAFAASRSPKMAAPMLELMQQSRAPQVARAWLTAHPHETVAGLLPLVETRSKLAAPTTDFLIRLLQSNSAYVALVEAELMNLPAERAATLRRALLDAAQPPFPQFDAQTTPTWLREALGTIKPTKRKPTTWLEPAELPYLTLDQHILNEQQREALLEALRQSTLDQPHPFITAIKQHLDSAQLDMFAWVLFESWLIGGGASKENWAMAALGLLGNDTSARKLTPLIRIWPGESQHQRAVFGLECLRAIGSDVALMQISHIAQKVKFKALQARAGECMERIATVRGLSREQLEDRVIADGGLDEQGQRTFDYGPRQFQFVLSPELKPLIRDAQGKLRPSLPAPNSKDDPALAAAAQEEWKVLKKQVGELATFQALRLEQAMIGGRQWQRDEFETLLVRHPVMRHLVRRLIWSAYDQGGTLANTFRVTEDFEYADCHDESFDLSAYPTVGLIHRMQIDDATQSAWGEVLSDYEILQPFPQLGRPLNFLEPSELQAHEITRFNHLKIAPATLVYGLDKRGWIRDLPADGGGYSGHSKPFYQANITAVVQYEEGVGVNYIAEAGDQNIEYIAFVPGIQEPQYWPTHKDRLPLSEVDPLVISEALSDLIAIMAKAT